MRVSKRREYPRVVHAPTDYTDDEWFINRIRHGYTLNGMTKMPAFEGILSQEAMWAIRTYLDSRYDGD